MALPGPSSGPINPQPVTHWEPEWIPAYLSNGLIGLRAGPIPLIEGLCIVNGLAAIDPVERGEGFARGPYPIGGDIELDGRRLSRTPDDARLIEQRYDFSCGELHSRFVFHSAESAATVESLIFCSRSLPSVVLQELTLTVDRPARLTITAKLDQTGIEGRLRARETETPGADHPIVDGSMLWETHGGTTTCGASYATQFEGGDGVERKRDIFNDVAPLSTSYSVEARPGRRYVLRQFTSLLPSQLHHEPHRQAARLAGMAVQRGFKTLRDENRGAWKEIWKGRIKLVGAGHDWQALADAAYYYLHASAHSSSIFSTSMFGLAFWPNYHYYQGHVMWDIETFAFPSLLLTAPEAARALLAYRVERLSTAHDNAALHGYRGIQFPWASGPRHGDEVIRLSAPHIVFEQHVSLDVALAFADYVHASGDENYLREQAWPILEGVANWVASRVVETARGYEIKEVIGVAEGTSPVDNNAYMNMVATRLLQEASAFARRLGRTYPSAWDDIARRLWIPIDEERGFVKNHERYRLEDQGTTAATPEALAGFFPWRYRVAPALERRTIEVYLGRANEFVGTPMLSALLGVYAAWIGDREASLRWFKQGYQDFVEAPYRETNEFSRTRFPDKPRVGPFMANIGGFLMGCLYGLPRLELSDADPEQWFKGAVVLPSGWEAIEVDTVYARGRPARLTAPHGGRARLEFH